MHPFGIVIIQDSLPPAFSELGRSTEKTGDVGFQRMAGNQNRDKKVLRAELPTLVFRHASLRRKSGRH